MTQKRIRRINRRLKFTFFDHTNIKTKTGIKSEMSKPCNDKNIKQFRQ